MGQQEPGIDRAQLDAQAGETGGVGVLGIHGTQSPIGLEFLVARPAGQGGRRVGGGTAIVVHEALGGGVQAQGRAQGQQYSGTQTVLAQAGRRHGAGGFALLLLVFHLPFLGRSFGIGRVIGKANPVPRPSCRRPWVPVQAGFCRGALSGEETFLCIVFWCCSGRREVKLRASDERTTGGKTSRCSTCRRPWTGRSPMQRGRCRSGRVAAF